LSRPKPRQKQYTIALIEGDGVGPEISKASLVVLDALQAKLGLRFSVKDSPAGDSCKRRTGIPLPESTLKLIRASDACLKAPVGETAADVIVRLRQMLDLYANVRPAKSLPNVPSLKPGIDMVIVRENTEDVYKGQEFEFDGGVVALRTITRFASERIAKYAFEEAGQRGGARKVVAVHKSNVLRKSDGLFAQVCREVSKGYPKISFSEMLVGGLGMTPSANIGADFALFEPVHGAAPDIAGKGVANPVAMILTVAMMLDWLAKTRQDKGCSAGATAIRSAVNRVLETSTRTPDLGGRATTMQVAEAVAKAIS
jgi:3-isopropylmalate dehydrogenase